MSKEFIGELSFKFDLTDEERSIVEYITDTVVTERKDVVDALSAWLLNRKMWLEGMKIDRKDPGTLFVKMRSRPTVVQQIVKRHFGGPDDGEDYIGT